jgi:hypothetical protein
MKVPFRRLGADALELTIEGEVVRLAREGTSGGDGEPAAEPVPSALHGTWLARDATGAVRLELRPDGRFVLVLESGEKAWRHAGRVGVRDGALVGKDDETGGALHMPFRAEGADALVVTIRDTPIRLARQRDGAPPAPAAPSAAAHPPGLVGEWTGSQFTVQGFDAGVLDLVLRADRTYSITWRLPGTVIPRAGTFQVIDGTLRFLAKGELPIAVTYRVAEGRLTLDAFPGMQPTVLSPAGRSPN